MGHSVGTWQRGTVVFIEGGAVWEGFLDWVALELGFLFAIRGKSSWAEGAAWRRPGRWGPGWEGPGAVMGQVGRWDCQKPLTAVWGLCYRRGHLSARVLGRGTYGGPWGISGRGALWGCPGTHGSTDVKTLPSTWRVGVLAAAPWASRKEAKLRLSEPQAQRPSFPGQCSGTPQEEEASLPEGEPQPFLVPCVRLSPGCWWAGDTLKCFSFPHRVQVVPICLSCAEP